MTGLAVLVVELERTVQLQIIVGVAEAAIAIGIPQDAIALGGEHKGDAHLGVVLEKIFVLAFHVEFFGLVLSESVECFGLVLELQRPRKTVVLLLRNSAHANLTLGNAEFAEGLSVLGLGCQLFAVGIEESDAAVALVDACGDILCLHHKFVFFL